jgi:hypothetical protein
MIGSKYLSDVLDTTQFQRGKINLIEAPCGCGKTTCAKGKIANLASSRNKVLYLIDTTNGCNVLAHCENTYKLCAWDIGEGRFYNTIAPIPYEEINPAFNQKPTNDMWVSTYANFGLLIREYGPALLNHFEIIIADEAHNMLQFATYSPQPNSASEARDAVRDSAISNKALVIAISATPQILRNDRRFSYYLHEVPFDKSDLRQYSQNEMGFFTDINDVMNTLPEGKKGALYTARISQMKRLEDIAREKGRNPISIWSMSNSEHPMSSQQEYVRQRILEDEAIPDEYDLFIFNASAETAINIRSEIDFVVVNNSDATHIKQARGRVRHDIDTLFVPQRLNVSIRLDEKYLNHPLTPQEKRAMRLSTGLKDSHGKPLPYAQLKERLINMGYSWAENEEGRVILSAPV